MRFVQINLFLWGGRKEMHTGSENTLMTLAPFCRTNGPISIKLGHKAILFSKVNYGHYNDVVKCFENMEI